MPLIFLACAEVRRWLHRSWHANWVSSATTLTQLLFCKCSAFENSIVGNGCSVFDATYLLFCFTSVHTQLQKITRRKMVSHDVIAGGAKGDKSVVVGERNDGQYGA